MSNTETVFSAARIAALIAADPEQPQLPTPEQQRVIEHPLGGSALVIAGAGSGKTETMANRVVWLVANSIVRPEEILGLTFTRKAAGELAERVQLRLAQFVERLVDADERGLLDSHESAQARRLVHELEDGWSLPEIATYDSFAGGIVTEFGAHAGISPSISLIDAAMAWGIARDVVLASEEPALGHSSRSIAALIGKVVELQHELSDNLRSVADVERVITEFSRSSSLPYDDKDTPEKPSTRPLRAPIRDAIETLEETRLIARLAEAFAAQKQRLGVIEFADQLRLAREIVQGAAGVTNVLRTRHRVVLLDEVQDTSVGQTGLLSNIFAGSSVMGVGDPHQSIYAWRGASASGMQAFHCDFGGSSQGLGATLSLSISWRNATKILEAANTVSDALREVSLIDVERLEPRSAAPEGDISLIYEETIDAETQAVAEWIRQARLEHLSTTGQPPTVALVMRNRRQMPEFSEQLTRAGIANHIVGVGGLLSTPEVSDLVSTLRCLWYADAGSDLIRLLAGPRFRIGVADLAGLRAAAHWFAVRDHTQRRLEAADLEADGVLLDPDRRFTILDALDEISQLRDLQHRALAGVSESGRERLREAGSMLRRLRALSGNGILTLLREVEHELRLDIELDAAEHRGCDGGAAARANLDAFAELVHGFLAVDEQGTLHTVLAWLEQASISDETAEHAPEPTPGSVQIITAHGSKGLEWDIVAIPRLVTDGFPSRPRTSRGWVQGGKIPDELRADAAGRPQLNWRLSTTQKELVDDLADYRTQGAEAHALEERRLAYVAITRARHRLLLSGSFWDTQVKPRTPSVFITELHEAGLLPELPGTSKYDRNPRETEERTLQWPLDPLGSRAEAVLRAAESVTRRLEAETAGEVELDPIVELLLAERAHTASAENGTPEQPQLADRITASTFHEFVGDPAAAERLRRRPLPTRPYRRTRLGNLFHEWVERRSTTVGGTELPLIGLETHQFSVDGFIADGEFADADAEQLTLLIEKFERSRWATLQPIAVELEIAIPFAGRRLVCKLDAVYELGGEGVTADVERDPTAEQTRFEIVDWKSGRPPANAAEAASRMLQLGLYRHAYAQWAQIDPERIDVSLFYVDAEHELRGSELPTLAELEAQWFTAAEQLTEGCETDSSEAPGGA